MKMFLPLTVILFILNVSAKAQLPRDSESNKVVYTEVVKLEGLSKEEIYKKSKMWIVSTLKSGDNMVELSGNSADQIVGTGNLILPDKEIRNMSNNLLNFKFIVFCKEGRLKYKVENFTLSFVLDLKMKSTGLDEFSLIFGSNPDRKTKAQLNFEEDVVVSVNKHLNLLINDFKSYMNKKEEDDW